MSAKACGHDAPCGEVCESLGCAAEQQPTCICGALLNSEECRLRAHTRGPRPHPKWCDLFGIDPDYTDGKPVDQWLHEQHTGHYDEQEAFVEVVTYHYRAAADRCACGPLPLGSSFPLHQWDEFVKMRSAGA